MKGLVTANKALSIKDNLDIPSPAPDEVLVKIKYSSIHSFDLENVNGKNDLVARLMGAKNLPVKTGIEFSGVVQANGKVFKEGDHVFGYPDLTKGLKAHQEYITIKEDYIALMPANTSFEESAAIPVGALTSLVALEELGKIKKGASVLINGAAGGLGVYAVQLSRIFGAKTTAVAGTGQEAFLKSLGADSVINYKEQKLEDLDQTYDILFDLTTMVKYSNIRKLLKPQGIFVPANPFTQLFPIFGNAFRKQKVAYLLVDKGNTHNLTRIAQWVEQQQLKPILDKTYPFRDFEKGFERTKERNKRGRIILQIED